MPFPGATPGAMDALKNGAFDIIQRSYRGDNPRRAAAEALRDYFGRIDPAAMPWQLAYALIDRYESARDSGAALQRKRSNASIDADQHTCVPGLGSNFAYVVIFEIYSPDTDETRSFPMTINSNNPMGKFDVLDMAAQAASDALDELSVGSDRFKGRTWEIQGEGRIRMALCNIEE